MEEHKRTDILKLDNMDKCLEHIEFCTKSMLSGTKRSETRQAEVILQSSCADLCTFICYGALKVLLTEYTLS